ncbi:hypothetical protein [Corynebacterium sp.]|uniref:hypothetical protein n=1 Tax=Corynebacterium sp. TaxID=1720 RepID=UPI0026DAA258|nr:hypothetical protein [Corynebacterium sp.]MDO5031265.1 hypothetical protein [Corynebacterium sp.]
MPSNDFDEFARGFRQRTAARLLEFEKAMAKAQEDLEKSAQRAAESARANTGSAERRTQGGWGAGGASRPNKNYKSVKSVLRSAYDPQ